MMISSMVKINWHCIYISEVAVMDPRVSEVMQSALQGQQQEFQSL